MSIKSINVVELTNLEEVLNDDRGDYNRTEWKKIVNRYNRYKSKFYRSNGKIYALYTINGINNFKELSFISSVDNMSVCFGCFTKDNSEIKYDNVNFRIKKNSEFNDRARNLSKSGYIFLIDF